jgi:hypothetical protein
MARSLPSGEAVIVVATIREIGVDRFRFPARWGEPVNTAFGIKQQKLAIVRPIRRLDEIHGVIHHPSIF